MWRFRSEFTLTDKNGKPPRIADPQIGNLIRIKLPAPSNKEGNGFDWFCIEEFEDSGSLLTDSDVFGFHVRPVRNPQNKTGNSAYFYTDEATSTFLVVQYSH